MVVDPGGQRQGCDAWFLYRDTGRTAGRFHHRSATVWGNRERRNSIWRLSMKLSGPLIGTALAMLAALALAGCAGDNYVPKSEPSFYRSMAQPGAVLDDAAAASMISGYRANNGLQAVTLDPELTRLAQAQASVMAQRDN